MLRTRLVPLFLLATSVAVGCGGSSSSSSNKDGAVDGSPADTGTADHPLDTAPLGGEVSVSPDTATEQPGVPTDAAMDTQTVDMQPDSAPDVVLAGLQIALIGPSPGASALCAKSNTLPTCAPDADDAAPGWQGPLTARVTRDMVPVASGTVVFAVNGTTVGMGTVANGQATFPVATPGIAEGAAVMISATISDAPGGGTATNTRTFIVDVTPPASGAALTVLPVQSEAERRDSTFRLQWAVPTDTGGLASYDIRYLKVNEGDTCAAFKPATATPSGVTVTPAASGNDTAVIKKLFVENNYCFGVVAADKVGNTLSLVTAMPAKHSLRRTIIGPQAPGAGEMMNEYFGISMDGSGDVNGDGSSDVIVGALNNKRAYIVFGAGTNFTKADATDFTGTTFPAIGAAGGPQATIIQGTSEGFGGTVSFIGNFDGDGLPEIAVAARNVNKVFIYKGRTSWPATLTEAQADWVVSANMTADTGYTIVSATSNPRFGFTLQRIGNFDGDAAGTEDLAIGVPGYPWDGATGYKNIGRVIIVRGASDMRAAGTSQTAITIPDAARSIVIDGDMALTQPAFGNAMVSLGKYYSDGLGTTLVVSAPGYLPTSSVGRIYAYRWLAGGSLGTSAPQVLSMAATAMGLAFGNDLVNLGSPSGLPYLGIVNVGDNVSVPGSTAGTIMVQGGSATAGPFGTRTIVNNVGRTNLGKVAFGGSTSATNLNLSIIGGSDDKVPDFVAANGLSPVSIMSGAKVYGVAGPVEISNADVQVAMPAGWKGFALRGGGLIPDVNADGMADFVVAETGAPGPGRIIIFW
jgi:hypothetical protein